ncbi:MAG: DUF4198 domain-containing protein [Deltaproteobacteria bacterium]|nr:MAG: DUF4198 domain-containing protein [Deltaproteobacteria bacterium]
MKKINWLILAFFMTLLFPMDLWAHFGAIIPSRSMCDQFHRNIEILFAFTHPFEQHSMNLERPKKAAIVNMTTQRGEVITSDLKPANYLGHKAWKIAYKIKRPGVYCIYMVPKPYWEPAEDVYIKHITKTYVAAFGEEEGWDRPIGLKTEIVPVTRPFGLYAGSTFRGRVYFDGKPAPYRTVEVEWYNKGGKIKAPTEYMVTQVVKTDEMGYFSFCAPHAGWWAFSALSTAPYTIKHNGKDKEVELGAVIWVKFLPWPSPKK